MITMRKRKRDWAITVRRGHWAVRCINRNKRRAISEARQVAAWFKRGWSNKDWFHKEAA